MEMNIYELLIFNTVLELHEPKVSEEVKVICESEDAGKLEHYFEKMFQSVRIEEKGSAFARRLLTEATEHIRYDVLLKNLMHFYETGEEYWFENL